MSNLILVSSLISLLFYVAIINRLFRTHLRKYFILFAYLLVVLLTWVIDTTLYYGQGAIGFREESRNIFFINDLARQAMVYVLVISLILRAVEGSTNFRWVGRWLVLGSVLLAGLFLWFHHDPQKIALWMTNVVRNFSFVAMLMNLLLWVLLLKKRTSDRTLLLVTSGLGIQMAGEAIGHSLRLMHPRTELAGNLILAIAHLCCLWIWFAAFRPKSAGATVAAGR
jgi:hypothetical protein